MKVEFDDKFYAGWDYYFAVAFYFVIQLNVKKVEELVMLLLIQ